MLWYKQFCPSGSCTHLLVHMCVWGLTCRECIPSSLGNNVKLLSKVAATFKLAPKLYNYSTSSTFSLTLQIVRLLIFAICWVLVSHCSFSYISLFNKRAEYLFHVYSQISNSIMCHSSLQPIFLWDCLSFSHWLKAFAIYFGYNSFVNYMCFK